MQSGKPVMAKSRLAGPFQILFQLPEEFNERAKSGKRIDAVDEILHCLSQLPSVTAQAARRSPFFHCGLVQDFGHSSMFANKVP